MKKFLCLFLTLVISLTLTVTAFASSVSAEWNGGEKINFNPLKYHKEYNSSDAAKDLVNKYGLKWYEDPARFVFKGEAMLLQLRTIQASLQRRGATLLSANGETLSNYKDVSTLVPAAQEEAKILKAIGILQSTNNSYMNMNQYTTRGEVAKIVAVTNQSVMGIPELKDPPSFVDINNHWSKDYIIHAYRVGLMSGVTSLNFYPDNAVTLEQLFIILNNQVGYYGITMQDVAKAMNETFKVTYNLDPIRITPEFDSYSVKLNYDVKVKVNVYPNSTKDLVFTSLDESICKVISVSQSTDTATVRGYKTGATYLKVHLKDEPEYAAIIPVYVTNVTIPATGITVNESITIEKGDSYYLTAVISPYNATNKLIKYTSSNTNIAKVDSNGKVTGVSEGTAVITVQTHNGYADYCIVTVKKQTTTTVPATGITLTSSVTLEEGAYQYLSAVVYPYNATDKTVKYYSTDTNIVKVDSNGKITAVKQGVAVIVAQTHNGYTASCIVTVTNKNIPATAVYVNSAITIREGGIYYLTTTVLPSNATDKTVTYSSDNSNIAKVNSNGLVTGVKPGTTVITVKTHNGLKAYCLVTVESSFVPATGITLNSSVNISVGDTYYLTATVLPYNASDKSVIYYSDDSSVAKVNSSGKVTGISPGVAVITAQTHNGFKAYCVVRVGETVIPATGISVADNKMSLEVGESKYIYAAVIPYTATDKTIKYYSDDSNIAVVNSSGKVTGVREGVAVITAETHNGHQTYCVVTVKANGQPQYSSNRSYMYVEGYEESSYYNAFNNETMNFIIKTDKSIKSVNLSNSYCYITKEVTKHPEGWQFTVKSSTLSQNGETLLTVTLSDGQVLTVRICIYP
jgi:uncharacterized protein YjdB